MTTSDAPTDEPFLVATDQAVVEVTGEERAGYLQDVTTQQLVDLEPGQVRGALHLEAHGAPLAMFDVVGLEDRFLLVAPDDGVADDLVESLGARTFLRDASFAPTGLRVRALRGAGAGDVHGRSGLPGQQLAGRSGRAAVGDDGLVVVGREGGLDLVGPPAALEPAADRLREAGAANGSMGDLEAWRIRAGVPAWGREIAAPHLPEEMGLLPTHVHLAKGCYPGQEAVARMWMLGRPRRRLARVRLRPPVEAGAELGSGRGKVRVTSVVADDGAADALAYVPADSEAGDEIEADEVVVEVVDLVGAGRPVPGREDAGPRRRDRDD